MLRISSIVVILDLCCCVTGLDWGGVRREWFESVCTELFDPSASQLFRRMSEDSQGLVSIYVSYHSCSGLDLHGVGMGLGESGLSLCVQSCDPSASLLFRRMSEDSQGLGSTLQPHYKVPHYNAVFNAPKLFDYFAICL